MAAIWQLYGKYLVIKQDVGPDVGSNVDICVWYIGMLLW
jgi:hypothetical protein